MARKSGSTGETTRPRIRAAAARLFAGSGYDAVTMRVIGAEAGLQAGALYRYFPDKRALAADLLAEAVAVRDRALDAAAASAPPEALAGFAEAYLQWRMSPGGGASLIDLLSGPLDATDAAEAPATRLEALLEAESEAGAVRLPDTRLGALAILAVLDRVADDTRLAPERRLRIGLRFARRLAGA